MGNNAEICRRKKCPYCKKIMIVETKQIDGEWYNANDGIFTLKLYKLEKYKKEANKNG